MPISPADAFLIPLFAGEVGIPLIGMHMLSTIEPAEGDALATRLAAQADAFRAKGPEVARQIAEVARLLARAGLVAAPPPATFDEYLRWADATIAAVAAATGPDVPAGATAVVGRG